MWLPNENAYFFSSGTAEHHHYSLSASHDSSVTSFSGMSRWDPMSCQVYQTTTLVCLSGLVLLLGVTINHGYLWWHRVEICCWTWQNATSASPYLFLVLVMLSNESTRTLWGLVTFIYHFDWLSDTRATACTTFDSLMLSTAYSNVQLLQDK